MQLVATLGPADTKPYSAYVLLRDTDLAAEESTAAVGEDPFANCIVQVVQTVIRRGSSLAAFPAVEAEPPPLLFSFFIIKGLSTG